MNAQETFEMRQAECLELIRKISKNTEGLEPSVATWGRCAELTVVLRQLQTVDDHFVIVRNDIADEQSADVPPRNTGETPGWMEQNVAYIRMRHDPERDLFAVMLLDLIIELNNQTAIQAEQLDRLADAVPSAG